MSARSAFLVDSAGVVQGAWRYENAELPDFDVLLEAARGLVVVRLIAFTAGMESTTSTVPSARRGASAKLTLGLGLVLVAAVVLFSFQSAWYGHWYALFRTAHVVLAVFWVGGGVLLTILGLRGRAELGPARAGDACAPGRLRRREALCSRRRPRRYSQGSR